MKLSFWWILYLTFCRCYQVFVKLLQPSNIQIMCVGHRLVAYWVKCRTCFLPKVIEVISRVTVTSITDWWTIKPYNLIYYRLYCVSIRASQSQAEYMQVWPFLHLTVVGLSDIHTNTVLWSFTLDKYCKLKPQSSSFISMLRFKSDQFQNIMVNPSLTIICQHLTRAGSLTKLTYIIFTPLVEEFSPIMYPLSFIIFRRRSCTSGEFVVLIFLLPVISLGYWWLVCGFVPHSRIFRRFKFSFTNFYVGSIASPFVRFLGNGFSVFIAVIQKGIVTFLLHINIFVIEGDFHSKVVFIFLSLSHIPYSYSSSISHSVLDLF